MWQPVQGQVQSVLPQSHFSCKPMDVMAQSSQPTADLVLTQTASCCSLFKTTPTDSHQAHPSPGFCTCRPLLYPNPAQPMSPLALINTLGCCSLTLPNPTPDPDFKYANRYHHFVQLTPSPASCPHQQEVQPNKEVATVPLPGMFPTLSLVSARGYCGSVT